MQASGLAVDNCDHGKVLAGLKHLVELVYQGESATLTNMIEHKEEEYLERDH